MTIDFNEQEILKIEQFTGLPLIGYINPQGKIIDYSILIGEYGHDNWRNPVTPIFLNFISFIIKNQKIPKFKFEGYEEFLEMNKYEGIDDIVKREVEYNNYFNHITYKTFLDTLQRNFEQEIVNAKLAQEYGYGQRDVFDTLRCDMVCFFQKLYSNNDFFGSVGKIICVENRDFIAKKYNIQDDSKIMEFYHQYLVVNLMSYMKDFCVQYLGYDSIERAIPYADLNIFNNIYDSSNGYKFFNNPRTITTSCININERFYNWLLMDWQIKRVPRYFWNDQSKKFELEQADYIFHKTDKEEILEQEIESIRNQIPRTKRKAYFK